MTFFRVTNVPRLSEWTWFIIALMTPTVAVAADLTVDFSQPQQRWDGFGANYVETRHTRDYTEFPQDYGGFKYLDDGEREHIIDLVFGEDGLRVALLKIFLDPFHEPENDNDDPLVLDPDKFDHETTTRWIRYFARRGLEKTRERGDDLQILVGLYGPPGWATKQGFRGRDLKPGYEAEVAEYIASYCRYLRDVEGLPVKFVSMHNEGGGKARWSEDGFDEVAQYKRDYNLWWPDRQIVRFLKSARVVLDTNGLPEVGLSTGETTRWGRLHRYPDKTGFVNEIAPAIRNSPQALENLALIASHGFGYKPGQTKSHDTAGIRLLREAKPQLPVWTTSSTWGEMNVEIAEDFRRLLYEVGCNGLIPWAIVHNDYESDKLSPPATFRVSTNPNSPLKTNGGDVEITKAYYHYKQLTRAGQRGMSVAAVDGNTAVVSAIAFAQNGTNHPNALVVINRGARPLNVTVQMKQPGSNRFAARVTSDVEYGDQDYADAGRYELQGGRFRYEAPPRSTSTFFVAD